MTPNQNSPYAMVDHLVGHQVPLVVIGGHAVNVHGFASATEDVDVVFRRSANSVQNLATALKEINAYWIGSEIDPATGIERIHSITADYIRTQHLMMLWARLSVCLIIPAHSTLGTDLGILGGRP